MDKEKKEPGEEGKEAESPSNYMIKITSDKDGKERQIKLSSGMYKLGVSSAVIGALLFLAASGYSVYSIMTYKNNEASIMEMEQAGEKQQEQLLSLSKKASKLSEGLQNLTQMESELRIQAGVKPAKDAEEKKEETPPPTNEAAPEGAETAESPEAKGQGGPINEMAFKDVEEALEIVEGKLTARRESLEELQRELKSQREQMAIMVNVSKNSATVIPQFNQTQLAQNAFAFETANIGGNVPSIWPTTGVVTSPYGLRWGGTDFHPGIDIANEMGTPILATADGVVEYAGWNSGGYGNMVDINHGNGIMTRYGHASQVVVSTGQYVTRGQVIALMGSTGFSTGPHVHYEVHVNGQRVNPISYL